MRGGSVMTFSSSPRQSSLLGVVIFSVALVVGAYLVSGGLAKIKLGSSSDGAITKSAGSSLGGVRSAGTGAFFRPPSPTTPRWAIPAHMPHPRSTKTSRR
jgi:hypothetical protein